MEGTFDSAKLMLAETQEYIGAFEAIANPFVSEDNWTFFIEIDPQTGDQLGKVQFKTDLSPRLAARTHDIFRYLRDALDHALFASAYMINGREPSRFKYPFGDTAVEVEREIVDHRRCEDLHPDILKVVIASRPYKAGNRPLWAVNKFRNRGTHKVLSPATAEGGFQLGNVRAGQGGLEIAGMSEWRSTRRQLTVARVSIPDADGYVQIAPTVTVSLNPAFGFDGPAVAVFRKATALVEDLITQIEAETLRIIAARG